MFKVEPLPNNKILIDVSDHKGSTNILSDLGNTFKALGIKDTSLITEGKLVLPDSIQIGEGRWDLNEVITNICLHHSLGDHSTDIDSIGKKIIFDEIEKRAHVFARHIDNMSDAIVAILNQYETHEVARDEIKRTLDLMLNIHENKEFFEKTIGEVASFLPKNQPLYALCCFGVIPALMANQVHVRPPLDMAHFFPSLVDALQLKIHFPNLKISYEERRKFVDSRLALTYNVSTQRKEPVTKTVIFTGTMENADKLRRLFDPSTLFIANGAGHNPIVVTDNADIDAAVHAALRVQLYNQGQDCANPSSILVHKNIYEKFTELLRAELKKVVVGPYTNHKVRVGPITSRHDLLRIQQLLIENAAWIDPETPGIIHTRTCIVEPTIITKPLTAGGNYTEQFAPIFFIQRYEGDEVLSKYFNDPKYAPNAMYISIFGDSNFIDSIHLMRTLEGNVLHTQETIIRGADLHAPGIERGTQPYGGFGRGASCLSINGRIWGTPTLPQRDIFKHLVEPNNIGNNHTS